MKKTEKIINFIKSEAVLCAALLLALISSFFVLPDSKYIGYIDWRTLAILFSLMSVMAGWSSAGVFERLACKMLSVVHGVRGLLVILVMLCFFSSMLITNDAALITFVPFTFIVLKKADKLNLAIGTVTMQTVGANLGSMLTPIGNPQNLYLYEQSGMNTGEFIMLMLPYSVAAFVILLVWCVVRRKEKLESEILLDEANAFSMSKAVIYLILFLVCILCVAHIIPYGICMAAVVVSVLIFDRQVLKKVDYSLLLTFIGFFIFIGNMGRVEVFYNFLESTIKGREAISAIAASQIISNVPAALLLSGFGANVSKLIVGVNLGGLGTLIASMASLISYKYLAREMKNKKGKYLVYFTAVNIIFLAVLTVLMTVLE